MRYQLKKNKKLKIKISHQKVKNYIYDSHQLQRKRIMQAKMNQQYSMGNNKKRD